MTDKKSNAVMKQVLELGPVLLFLAGYIYLREETLTIGGRDYDGFIVITGLFVPLLIASNAALWKLTGKVSRIQIMTLVMVVVFGGLTVWLNDERFFKMKSTIVFGIFAALLGIGLARGQSWLEFVLDGAIPLTHAGWMALTKRLTLFLVGMSVANEIIWRSFSTDVYVAWDTFGQMAAMFAFFISQSGLMNRHWEEEGDDKTDA
ncbi:inner membrane-spanning protein YciB [Meridianimarinicoccus aquatilis]|uniref:Inner membrane-spanning protein YciB n=1 Tax=Meridianimarinicoccus aquatilis TaxID=2552766 RepID=A0A4R6B5A0_9RHOB|nr:inner membrane-spanning protein YciB [Fluviibacterium aquatile]QIE42423.1 septation protein IspZ [Rhodobacteraceae bacterium SC52]TDL91178.1 septation protein IspZ [Fluviibacterium aquatile]